MQDEMIRSWTADDFLFKLLQQSFVHKFIHKKPMKIFNSNINNTNQIKLDVILSYMYRGELMA